MLNANLLPGDKYDARCAEVFITKRRLLIYHCSLCEEIYTTFDELYSHITNGHYQNTKELNNKDSLDNVAKKETNKENQFASNKILGRTKKRVDFEKKSVIKKNGREILTETHEVKTPLENMATILRPAKKVIKRRKLQTNSCKTYFHEKTKAVTLAQHHDHPNDVRKYICGVCGFAFKEKHNLRSHLLRHSNHKKFKCFICTKKFLTKADLRFHEFSHNNERSYMCDYCGMGFLKSSSLTQHIKKCNKCLEPLSSSHQKKDCKSLLPKVSSKILLNCQNAVKIHEHIQNVGKPHSLQRKISKSEFDNSCKKVEENLFENDFFLEQNFDEYELVQTLSDLECNKYV